MKGKKQAGGKKKTGGGGDDDQGGGGAKAESTVLTGTPGEGGETVDFGLERTEALTGRRRKSEKAKSKGGGFESMDILPEVFRAIKRKGYRIPTPIQRKAIPVALSGADVVAMARTGSGKTAAFLIPVLHKLRQHSLKAGARAVVLSPTRELALQTFKFAQELSKFTDLRSVCIVGGDSMEAQFDDLASNPDLLVATPGRLLHHVEEISGFSIRAVSHVVLDEADRLLEMGFSDQLRDIIKQVADQRQCLLFSATMPSALAEFVRVGLKDPQVIRLDAEMKVSPDLKLSFAVMRQDEKIPALLFYLREVVPEKQQTVVFTATRHHVELLVTVLEHEGMTVSAVYGSMDMAARKLHIGRFRSRKTSVMVVTDVAARGIDIPLLDNVVNFDFPPRPKLFVHRVGRVARAGRTGIAHSLLVKEEMGFLVDLHLFLGRSLVAAPLKPPESREQARRIADEADEAQRSVVGIVPPTSLDLVQDRVRELFDARTELDGLRRACENAYRLYQRTRGSAANESVARGAELIESIGPSPTMCAALRDEAQLDAAGLAEIAQQIKAYRPVATVFEAEIANAAKGQNLMAVAAALLRPSLRVAVLEPPRAALLPAVDERVLLGPSRGDAPVGLLLPLLVNLSDGFLVLLGVGAGLRLDSLVAPRAVHLVGVDLHVVALLLVPDANPPLLRDTLAVLLHDVHGGVVQRALEAEAVLHRPSPVVLHRAQTELGVVHASGRDVEEKGVIAEFARVKRIRHGDSLLLFALSLRFRILLGLGLGLAFVAKLVVAVALVAVVVGPLRLRPASTPGHDTVPRLLRLLDEGIVLLALGRHRGV